MSIVHLMVSEARVPGVEAQLPAGVGRPQLLHQRPERGVRGLLEAVRERDVQGLHVRLQAHRWSLQLY